jgi:hypothetical protein
MPSYCELMREEFFLEYPPTNQIKSLHLHMPTIVSMWKIAVGAVKVTKRRCLNYERFYRADSIFNCIEAWIGLNR